jgi:NADPH:quinone reductase-like Zn-dependent oxidoreductase
MKAITIAPQPEGARYVLAEAPEPAVGPADLLVEVHASAINQADLRYAAAHFAASQPASGPAPGPAIGGLELAGEVIAVGERATGFAVGDRVMAMTGRAWAERVPVDHRLAVPVPGGFGWRDAAATPVSYITAHDCITAAARLRPGESLLVQGATAAAGLAVVQIARHAGARPVFGTTSKEAKVERLRSLGCGVPIVRGSTDVVETVRWATGGRGADVVVDILGGAALQENVAAAAVLGRVICLGRVTGPCGELDLDEFARKRIQMTGISFRTRTFDERCAVVARFIRELLPALETKEVRPVWDRSFDWADCSEAEAFLRSGSQFGKVLLSMKPGA